LELLILDFLNTEWFATHLHKQDVLLTPKLLTEFLRKWRIEPSARPTPEAIRALVEYRVFLSGALKELIGGQRIFEETAAELNRVLSLAPGVRSACTEGEKYQTRFQPLRKDWNWVMAEVAESFFALMSMDIGRIRVCENPGCQWVFYDETRSRTKRCCDDTCASLVKVRRHRAKIKESKDNTNSKYKCVVASALFAQCCVALRST
jgi:predicted RNA-binding Zn ribbon-like protein